MGEESLAKDGVAEQTLGQQSLSVQGVENQSIDEIMSRMTLDEKLAQMVIVACRTWDGTDVESLDIAENQDLKTALQKHQYGGVLLYGSNIKSTEQAGNLVNQLQANNMEASGVSTHIPYFMAVDEEGGVVMRFGTGTRMTGSMAIAATGDKAETNAKITGQILGEECAALGFNVDFAPTIDVNSNPENPVIGTRSFGDVPNTVATLGNQFVAGLAEKKEVISTIKHFPGHGDAGEDTHIKTSTVDKTIEELRACELIPFKSAIDNGADLIMTAHITLPKYDDEQVFASGETGYYPATMSRKAITELLRGELGYQGVVITDALEMGAIGKAKLVPRDVAEDGTQSPEYAANIAEKCINAGVDILLLPRDLKDANAATFYDDYFRLLADKVGEGEGKTISMDRIDQSVRRILEFKQKYDFLNSYTQVDINAAKATVGSEAHRSEEMRIAREAQTLLKNDSYTLPISGHNSNVVIVMRDKADNVTVTAALEDLKSAGVLAEDVYVNNFAAGKISGSEDSKTRITIDCYRDGNEFHVTDYLKNAIKDADVVVCASVNWGLSALQPGNVQYDAPVEIQSAAKVAGAKFVLLSCNLPYDVVRFQDADALLQCYMSSGAVVDPSVLVGGQLQNYNANIRVAIEALFDNMPPTGSLPVNIPGITNKEQGTISYDTSQTLFVRGTSLRYAYAFTEGANSTHEHATAGNLNFKNNARYDKLTGVFVDDGSLAAGD